MSVLENRRPRPHLRCVRAACYATCVALQELLSGARLSVQPQPSGGAEDDEDFDEQTFGVQLASVPQILFENGDGQCEALDFNRLLLGAIWIEIIVAPDLTPFDAGKAIPVCDEKLLLIFTDADHFGAHLLIHFPQCIAHS